MGRVHNKTMKKAAWVIPEKDYTHLGSDVHTTRRVCEDIASIPSKKVRNEAVGSGTHLLRRIHRGPARGISVTPQEERERRENYVPEVFEIGPGMREILKLVDFGSPSNLLVTQPTVGVNFKTPRGAV